MARTQAHEWRQRAVNGLETVPEGRVMGLVGLEVWGLSTGVGALEKVNNSVESCPIQYGSHHTHAPMEMYF